MIIAVWLAGEFEQGELGTVGRDTANVAVGVPERDVHRGDAVLCRV